MPRIDNVTRRPIRKPSMREFLMLMPKTMPAKPKSMEARKGNSPGSKTPARTERRIPTPTGRSIHLINNHHNRLFLNMDISAFPMNGCDESITLA
jgi:hypothetical protein